MEWYLKVVRDNYANFKGRARRKEYWMFVLVNLGIAIVAAIIDNLIGFSTNGGPVSGIYSLAVLVPSIAVGVRRLHDVGKSGWYLLIAFIPIAGAIYLIYLFAQEGDEASNEYGPNPKLEELPIRE